MYACMHVCMHAFVCVCYLYVIHILHMCARYNICQQVVYDVHHMPVWLATVGISPGTPP